MTHAENKRETSRRKPRLRVGLQVYALTWMLLAGGAAYYLSTSVAWPELMARYGTSPLDLKQQSNEAQRAQASLSLELKQSQSDLDRLRTEVQRLRSEASDHASEIAGLRAELAKVQSAGSAPVAAAQPEATAEPAAPAVALRESQPAPQPVASLSNGRTPPLPPRAPRDVTMASRIVADSLGNPLIVNPVTTGSITRLQPPAAATPDRAKPQDRAPTTETAAPAPAGPITFGEPVVTTAPGTGQDGVALRLSTAPSLDSLRLSWRVLNERHGSLLQGLEPRYRSVPGGATGTAYQLLAGPVLSRAEGDQICTMLRVQSVSCAVDSFSGETL